MSNQVSVLRRLMDSVAGLASGSYVPDSPERLAHLIWKGEGVPRVIHQVYGLWEDGPLPTRFRALVAGWKRQHPRWLHVLWDKDQVHALVQRKFPQVWELFRRFPRGAMQAQVASYLILNTFGGVYADIDAGPVGSLDRLLEEHPKARAFVPVEAVLTPQEADRRGQEHPIREGQPEHPMRLGNHFLIFPPGHGILAEIVGRVMERSIETVTEDDYDVEYITGSDALTQAVHDHKDRFPDLVLLPRRTADRYLSHRGRGEWRRLRDNLEWVVPGVPRPRPRRP
ncbi:MAG TPA: glycosyltransferase [Candidatus Nitrosotenuis sp.]|nr:glycosyltransferase [Candidatus Nitrosotenuis sp.]